MLFRKLLIKKESHLFDMMFQKIPVNNYMCNHKIVDFVRLEYMLHHLSRDLSYKGYYLNLKKIELTSSHIKQCNFLLKFLQFWQTDPLKKHGHWHDGLCGLFIKAQVPPFKQFKSQSPIKNNSYISRIWFFKFSIIFSRNYSFYKLFMRKNSKSWSSEKQIVL